MSHGYMASKGSPVTTSKITMYRTLLLPEQPKPRFLCPLFTHILFSSLTVIWRLLPSSLTFVTLHDALPPEKCNVEGHLCVGRGAEREH